MAVNPKTPGVYIEEIPVFPASIAGVATAVPAFMGYVERAESNGVGIPLNTPTRITSLLEYETIFGKGESQVFVITINDNTSVSPVQRTVTSAKGPAESVFKLYYNVQMYFANGGGPCYIVPVGLYSGTTVTLAPMQAGLAAISKVDEPTLLLFPDAISLSLANRKTIYDASLAQCEKLKDRFTIMDCSHNGTNTVFADAADFRNSTVGPDNLKYGASYYPFLNTTLGFSLNENLVHIDFQTQNPPAVPVPVTNSATSITMLNSMELTLFKAQQGLSAARIDTVNLTNGLTVPAYASVNSEILLFQAAMAAALSALTTPFQTAFNAVFASVTTGAGAFKSANTAYNTTGQTRANADALIAAYNQLILDLQAIRVTAYSTLSTVLPALAVGSLANIKATSPSLYNTIIAQLTSYTVQLNPSGAMAGIYARVDNERGVWKAPANVGVRGITGPSINVTNSEQDDLNVDATSGKSINVIRSFTGRGTLVWGARTLAGNDNEWRYINVRRLFTYVEESVQEATAFVVFEPNTANTWQRTIGMIEAFLTGLWRDGALAGATTKEAYFVRCGIGVTMTAQDILEGRMIVEIGMAAVRPAEFIILKFEHKLQES
jgi:Bacteriophage tail sheath protein